MKKYTSVLYQEWWWIIVMNQNILFKIYYVVHKYDKYDRKTEMFNP